MHALLEAAGGLHAIGLQHEAALRANGAGSGGGLGDGVPEAYRDSGQSTSISKKWSGYQDLTEHEYLEKVTHQIDNMAYLSLGIDKLLAHFEGASGTSTRKI